MNMQKNKKLVQEGIPRKGIQGRDEEEGTKQK